MELKQKLLTPDEYLSFEMQSEIRHEYFDGHIYAMTGASRNHNRIMMNVSTAIHQHLKGSPCNVYSVDMKLKLNPNNSTAFYYPDLMVSCINNPESDYYETDAILIIEILSKSTRKYDETAKRMAYQQLPSLIEYCLIEQDTKQITRFTFNNDITRREIFEYGLLELNSIGLLLSFDDIYHGVNFKEG